MSVRFTFDTFDRFVRCLYMNDAAVVRPKWSLKPFFGLLFEDVVHFFQVTNEVTMRGTVLLGVSLFN